MRARWHRRFGATATETGLIVGLIAVAIIGVLAVTGVRLADVLGTAGDCLAGESCDIADIPRPVAGEPDPGAFALPAVTNAALGALVTSDIVQLPAFEGTATLQIGSGATILVDGSAVGRSVSVTGGAQFQLQMRAAETESTTVELLVITGSRSQSWQVTTGDMTPAFTLAPSRADFPAQTVTATVTPGSFTLPITVSVTDDSSEAGLPPQLSADGIAFAADPIQLQPGAAFWLRRTALAQSDGAVLRASVQAGNAPAQIWTLASPDTVPEAFAFAPVTDAEPGETRTSETVTLSGFDAAAEVALTVVEGAGAVPLLQVNGGAFAPAPASVPANATLALQLVAGSVADGTARVVRLEVGGVAADWSVATVDRTPEQFAFVDVQDRPFGSLATASAPLAGFTGTLSATVEGEGNPQIRIGEGAWSAGPLEVTAGDEIGVGLTLGSADEDMRSATVSLGGVSDSFEATTGRASPDGLAFADSTASRAGQWVSSPAAQLSGMTLDASDWSLTAGGAYDVRLGVNGAPPSAVLPTLLPRNASLVLALPSSGDPAEPARSATLRIHGAETSWTLTTESTQPDAFGFADSTGRPASTETISDPVQLAGMTLPAPFSLSAEGQAVAVEVNGVWQEQVPQTVPANARLRLRLVTGPVENGQPDVVTVDVGGTSGYWQVFTRDTQPDAFEVAARIAQPLSTAVASDWIPIAGIDSPATISLSGAGDPQMLVEGDALWHGADAPQSIANGQRFMVRLTSAAAESTEVSASVSVGGVSRLFRVTTGRATPDAFDIAATTGAQPGAPVSSGDIQLSGMSLPASYSLTSSTGGAVSLVAVPAVQSGRIPANARLVLTSTAPAGTDGQAHSVSLTVGGLTRSWAVTNIDTTPIAFDWGRLEGQEAGATVESATLTLSGFAQNAPIAVSGDGSPEVSVNGGAFTASPAPVPADATLAVRLAANATPLAEHTAVVTVGGVEGRFTLRTQGVDDTPEALVLAPRAGQQPNDPVVSDAILPAGFDRPLTLSVSGGGAEVSVAGGGWTGSATILPAQSFRLRMTSGSFGATKEATVSLGSVSAPWSVTSRAEDATPDMLTAAQLPPQTRQAGNTFIFVPAFVPSGYSDPAPVSISGTGNPRIRIAGGSWTGSGTISPGQTLEVGLTTGAPDGGIFEAALTLGKNVEPVGWSVGVVDTIPTYSWGPDITNQAHSTWMSYNYDAADGGGSRLITPTNFTDPTTYSCNSPGENVCHFHRYHDGLLYNAGGGIIYPGDSLILHMWTASGNNATRTCNCEIGGVWDAFSSTTGPQDIFPDPFVFSPAFGAVAGQWVYSNIVTPVGYNDPSAVVMGAPNLEFSVNGAAWQSANGTIQPGQTIQLRANPQQAGTVTLNAYLGTMTAPWSVSTAPQDDTPDQLWNGRYVWNNASPTDRVSTGAVLPVGYNAQGRVRSSGANVYFGNGVTEIGNIHDPNNYVYLTPGQNFWIIMNPAPTPRTTTTGWISIGNMRVDLEVTTADLDDTPNQFVIVPMTGQQPNTPVETQLSLDGFTFNALANLSGAGGAQMSVGGGGWTNSAWVNAGQAIRLRMTTGPADGSMRRATLTVSGISANWDVTTLDQTPVLSPAQFPGVTADPGAFMQSETVTVSGLGQAVPISVSGPGSPSFSVNRSGASAVIGNGDTVQVMATADTAFGASRSVSVTIGAVTTQWVLATRAEDRTPTAFPIARKADQPPGSRTPSNPVTPYNFEDPAPISVTGDGEPTISVAGGAEATSGTIAKGQSFIVRLTSSAASGGIARATVTIGGVSSVFEVQTRTVGQ